MSNQCYYYTDPGDTEVGSVSSFSMKFKNSADKKSLRFSNAESLAMEFLSEKDKLKAFGNDNMGAPPIDQVESSTGKSE